MGSNKYSGRSDRRSFICEPKKQEVMDLMARRFKRELINKGILPDPAARAARYKFTWVYGNLNGTVYADNRSLARSLIKQELGIKKKNRLPIEVEIDRQPNGDQDEDSTGESEEDSECDPDGVETCGAI